MFEETGIKGKELKELYNKVYGECIYQGYLCVTDIEKNKIVLQPGETIGYKWVSKEEFMEVYNSDNYLRHLRENLREFVIEKNFIL